jgi:hypothetical protein
MLLAMSNERFGCREILLGYDFAVRYWHIACKYADSSEQHHCSPLIANLFIGGR